MSMRDWWYGDKRDIVKWGTLLALASRERIDHILQVALYRPERRDYFLRFGNEDMPLPRAVIQHFRNLNDIKRLARVSGRRIEVFKLDFQRTPSFRTDDDFRVHYFRLLADKLGDLAGHRVIVFLDPDTGIAPATFDYKHMTTREIETIVGHMKSNDVLVFYQHAQRDRKWRQKMRSKFCAAVQEKPAAVAIVTCKEVANDVCFFVYTKP